MGNGSGRGGGRYTSMGFGFPPMFFSLIWFSWLKPVYDVPRGRASFVFVLRSKGSCVLLELLFGGAP